MTPTHAHRFITIEGGDGSGKSSHLQALADLLRSTGAEVVVTREPGGTPLGEKLRSLVLSTPMTLRTEALLVFAARHEHLELVIKPALASGAWVLCDRFTDSTVAYQGGGRGLPLEQIQILEDWVHPDIQPSLTLLFDLDPAIADRRMAGRNLDRFEKESLAFRTRIRESYLARAAQAPERFRVIDSSLPLREVQIIALAQLRAWLDANTL